MPDDLSKDAGTSDMPRHLLAAVDLFELVYGGLVFRRLAAADIHPGNRIPGGNCRNQHFESRLTGASVPVVAYCLLSVVIVSIAG